MKVLVVPDSFKGSISSVEFCRIAQAALAQVDATAQIESMPLADGGEGMVEALVLNKGGKLEYKVVNDPLCRQVRASYGILADGKTAVIEMAAASGLPLLDVGERDPLLASTYGTGELILDALQKGCSRLIMGIGGSATNDCGMGMLQALGFAFLDKDGRPLRGCGGNLGKVVKIDRSKLKVALDKVECLVACDVENRLCGEFGATYTYGKQKGATQEVLAELEAGMLSYNRVVSAAIGKDVSKIAGSGAAGGLGAGLLAFLQGRLCSGFSLIAQEVALEKKIATGNFDLIITGEGRIDSQTANGKLPLGVAKLGKENGGGLWAKG